MTTKISDDNIVSIIQTLKTRFEKNMYRHPNLTWSDIELKIAVSEAKLISLYQMEATGGEPDVVVLAGADDDIVFYDCATESPLGRRSLCYDNQALESRKENKPINSAMQMAKEIGIEILNETQYKELQKITPFDLKTSSWVHTPDNIRKLGGAIFCDCRYKTVFTYHNGAESYYAARGFRGLLRI